MCSGATARRPTTTRRTRARARKVADGLSQGEAELLTRNISAGLPGATTFSQNLDAFRERIASYRRHHAGQDARERGGIPRRRSRRSPKQLGVRLTLHPDDPPRPIFGLPRIASTARRLRGAVRGGAVARRTASASASAASGARPDNDVVAMAQDFGPRIYFAHLRATRSTTTARASASPSPIISTAT